MAPRVLYAEFLHETNTFSIRQTGEPEFRQGRYYLGPEVPKIYSGTHTSAGAAFEAAARYGWELITPISAEATPSGRVVQRFFDDTAGRIVDAARATPPDGVLLHLHGSMVTEVFEDGDGELLARLRAAIGPSVPVFVVVDVHATVTELMAQHANGLISYRTYPHVDMYDRTWQAAHLLARAIAGTIRPQITVGRAPLLFGCDGGRTLTGSPMNALLDRANQAEQSGEALVVSIQAGFSSMDVPDIGPSVAVTTDGDPAGGERLAQVFSELIWATRDFSSISFTPLDEAVTLARAGEGAGRPLIIADFADNPGAGAYGDGTALLAAMLRGGLRKAILHAIYDPAVVQTAIAAGIGNTIDVELGGKTDPTLGGGPLRVQGTVTRISNGCFVAYGPMGGGAPRNDGPTVVLRINDIDVVVASSNNQATDLGQITSVGLDPMRAWTIAVKSMNHFRAAFAPISRAILEVDTGALCTRNYLSRPYQHIRRPIYPFDKVSYGDQLGER
jgi:microcystin degradation protein MlrC